MSKAVNEHPLLPILCATKPVSVPKSHLRQDALIQHRDLGACKHKIEVDFDAVIRPRGQIIQQNCAVIAH